MSKICKLKSLELKSLCNKKYFQRHVKIKLMCMPILYTCETRTVTGELEKINETLH